MSVELVLCLNGAEVPVVLDDTALATLAAAIPREPIKPTSPYLTVNEACEYARMNRQRIYDLRSAGRLSRLKGVVLRAELDEVLRGER